MQLHPATSNWVTIQIPCYFQLKPISLGYFPLFFQLKKTVTTKTVKEAGTLKFKVTVNKIWSKFSKFRFLLFTLRKHLNLICRKKTQNLDKNARYMGRVFWVS